MKGNPVVWAICSGQFGTSKSIFYRSAFNSVRLSLVWVYVNGNVDHKPLRQRKVVFVSVEHYSYHWNKRGKGLPNLLSAIILGGNSLRRASPWCFDVSPQRFLKTLLLKFFCKEKKCDMLIFIFLPISWVYILAFCFPPNNPGPGMQCTQIIVRHCSMPS